MISRLTPWVILIWLISASHVDVQNAIATVASKIIALCDACQALMLGERHRKPESPMLFVELVTRLATKGERILVGLEISATQQDALDAVMASKRGPEDLAHPIIDSPSFRNMLLELSRLYQAYEGFITVAAIDASDKDMGRDAAMARHLRSYLASGQFERVVVLVGNLHTIQKMAWAKDAGRQSPYLAERLTHAGIAVTSVMQDFGSACHHLRHPVFYGTAQPQGLEALSRQLDVVNHQPRMDKRQASDGIVVWKCRE